MKILMVCLGNICRSPLAEGIMQHRINNEGLNWTVDSAGTGAYHVGEQADPRSRAVAKVYGLDIDHQQARQFQKQDFQDFDLILAMDGSNYRNILTLASSKDERKKVHKILTLAQQSKDDIPDPYWDDNGFEHVFQLLDNACGQILAQLMADAPLSA